MRKTLGTLALAAVLFGVTACGSEWGEDAPVNARDDGIPADIYTMPDGFSNIATKCDRNGNRMYTIYHGSNVNSSPYGALAVVPNDPTCAALKVAPK